MPPVPAPPAMAELTVTVRAGSAKKVCVAPVSSVSGTPVAMVRPPPLLFWTVPLFQLKVRVAVPAPAVMLVAAKVPLVRFTVAVLPVAVSVWFPSVSVPAMSVPVPCTFSVP